MSPTRAALIMIGMSVSLSPLVACGGGGGAPADASQQPSLEGSIACNSLICGDGQLCVDQQELGSDGGSEDATDHYSCIEAPTSCSLAACDGSIDNGGDCPQCVVNLCAGIPSLGGRYLSCYPF